MIDTAHGSSISGVRQLDVYGPRDRTPPGDGDPSEGPVPTRRDGAIPGLKPGATRGYQRVIDDSDYYVLIVGGRYGSMAAGISYTEQEFDYAVEQVKPVLAFVHENPGSISFDARQSAAGRRTSEIPPEGDDRSNGELFSNADQLAMRVNWAVERAKSETPGDGWVRGSEIAALQTELTTSSSKFSPTPSQHLSYRTTSRPATISTCSNPTSCTRALIPSFFAWNPVLPQSSCRSPGMKCYSQLARLSSMRVTIPTSPLGSVDLPLKFRAVTGRCGPRFRQSH